MLGRATSIAAGRAVLLPQAREHARARRAVLAKTGARKLAYVGHSQAGGPGRRRRSDARALPLPALLAKLPSSQRRPCM